MRSLYREIQFSDEDVVNVWEWIPEGQVNPHKMRPWLLHDHGFVVCVVFATSEQEALDEAADDGRLDRYALSVEDLADYVVPRDKGKRLVEAETEGVSYLGNASEPFDIQTLDIVELRNPPVSFCASYNLLEPS